MLKELGAKLRGIVICLLTWACFFSAIIAPRCVGIPATLNVFGVYELPITIPLVLVWKYGIINFEIVVLTFLYVGLPIVMGVVFFIFHVCVCLLLKLGSFQCLKKKSRK